MSIRNAPIDPRNRIRGLARLPKARVLPHPANYRQHDSRQRTILRSLLADVGVVGALLVVPADAAALASLRASPDFAAWLAGYSGAFTLLDGHMRRDELRGELTCIVLDLDPRESAEVVATFDPVGALARADSVLLDELTRQAGSVHPCVAELIASLTPGRVSGDGGDEEPGEDKPRRLTECPACGERFEASKAKKVKA